MQICRRPRFEVQIRLVVNENDVHFVTHVLNGIVDLIQLFRVRPLLHGSTLLTVTDGVTVFAFCTRSSIFSLISWFGTFPTISRVPPMITIFLTSRLSARHTSSITTPMSSSVALDFLRTMIFSFPLADISSVMSRNKLLPASSVTEGGLTLSDVVSVVVVGMLMFSLSFRRSCCCSTTRATSFLVGTCQLVDQRFEGRRFLYQARL